MFGFLILLRLLIHLYYLELSVSSLAEDVIGKGEREEGKELKRRRTIDWQEDKCQERSAGRAPSWP